MNKFWLAIIFTFIFGFLPALSFAQTKAVWVRPLIDAEIETRKDAAKGREFIRRELERIKRARLNTVYVEAFWDGYTIYPSQFVAQRPLAIPYGVAQEKETWDVLQTYLDEGAKLNLKIHAWLHVFHQWNTNLGNLEKSPIFSRHPDWAVLSQSGSPFVKSEAEGANRDVYKVFLSPSNPEVRKYLREVVAELAEKYPDLGGVQWDYIRYPLHSADETFDYNPLTLMQFQKEIGLNARQLSAEKTPAEWRVWQDWKTRQVTEVVQELGGVVRKKQPQWEISAAVFPNFQENLRLKMQDSQNWAREKRVDALLPMLYSIDYARVEAWAKDFKAGVPAQTKIYVAIFINHFYDPNEKTFDKRYLKLIEKLKFDGFGLFAAQSLTDDLIEKLNVKPFKR